MGREGNSRGTTQVARIRRLRLACRSALTNISLSCNVEITVQTTRKIIHLNGSRGNFNCFRSSATFSESVAHL